MSKLTKQEDKLKLAIITSTILHAILFTALIWSSLGKHIDASTSDRWDSSIKAVMVDPGTIVQNFKQRQDENAKHTTLKSEIRILREETTRQDYEQQRQAKEVIKKEQERQKSVAIPTAKKEQERQKSVAIPTAKKEQERQKSVAIPTAKKEQEKETAASYVEELFDNLSSNNHAQKTSNKAKTETSNTQNNDSSSTDINKYAEQIKSAIESRFYDASSYAGKTCTLRIKLAADGMLLDIKFEGGDPELCNAAAAAARQAQIPKPPSQAVYEVFKNTPLDFKP